MDVQFWAGGRGGMGTKKELLIALGVFGYFQ
jgi:hypothetical protein